MPWTAQPAAEPTPSPSPPGPALALKAAESAPPVASTPDVTETPVQPISPEGPPPCSYTDWDHVHGLVQSSKYHVTATASAVGRLRDKFDTLLAKHDRLHDGVQDLIKQSKLHRRPSGSYAVGNRVLTGSGLPRSRSKSPTKKVV